ncbi:uncharacterized protein [Aristolochia californica]|uniref:uncharacterized protein n=1 Tax=Aristolochia californica TaxID=171875 RepID=UPI0035DC46E7
MGQSINKLSKGGKQPPQTSKKLDPEKIRNTVDRCYQTYLEGSDSNHAHFHYAVCKTVEVINVELCGFTQIMMPSEKKIGELYEKNRDRKGEIPQGKFEIILMELFKGAQIGGGGSFRDMFLFIYGFPVTAVLVKQLLFPDSIPNEILIPAVTSASVFALAKQNKI